MEDEDTITALLDELAETRESIAQIKRQLALPKAGYKESLSPWRPRYKWRMQATHALRMYGARQQELQETIAKMRRERNEEYQKARNSTFIEVAREMLPRDDFLKIIAEVERRTQP